MASNEGIFSLRLVIADFYMEKPVPGLDPVYSEFRGKEIKKVPIIRVFGSNAQGQKTCMHVHGVFPYFYVPYDKKDFESVNKAIYQIALNLDKAINISLSQGSSAVQHVFKVQLVKGIPFYGYHRSDHQYLKIYMFNPRFVRRAANLLQNGAIMNKNFHPHEAHVPYILQFMIDFNLYGMSFIHVPLEIVKFRRCDPSEVIPFKNLKESQILDSNVAKKLSCCKLECDIGSNFILNRFQLVTKTSSTHSNPGIESIWNDEKIRRQKMAQTLEHDEEKLNAIPALEVPATQERPNVYATESETFYRTALVSKLSAMEMSMMDNTQLSDQTINSTFQTTISNVTNINLNASLAAMKQQKRTFSLTKILQNSVYPEECSQNDNLVNASFVENHLTSNNVFQQSLCTDLPEVEQRHKDQKRSEDDESIFLEDTIVDEELVLSLTQSQEPHVPHNATLRDEDMELLDILQQLEEDNNNGTVDLDSSLAPLTQNHKNFDLSPELLDKETTASVMQKPTSDSDSDGENETDDNLHDFSIALENLDDLILKLTQSATDNTLASPVPQTDGSDDLPKTPTKAASSSKTTTVTAKTPPRTPTTPKQRRLTLASPSRSPRTPKSGHKYKPLPLIITNRSTGKTICINPSDDKTTPCKTSVVDKSNNLPLVSLRKKLAMTELRRKSISLETDNQDYQNDELTAISASTNVTKRRSKRIIDLNKTHVTCNLTPRRTNEKLLRVYNVDTNENESHVEDLREKETRKSTPANINKRQRNSQRSIDKSSKDTDASGGNKSKEVSKDVTEKHQENAQSNDRDKENEVQISSSDSALDDNNANSQASEEILDSDIETKYPSVHLRETPNLKRLRRSFLSTYSAKRRKVEGNQENLQTLSKSSKGEQQIREHTTISRDEIVINSSQIESDKDILESEKPEQKDKKQISPEIHVEKGMRNMYNNLMNLAEALNRIDQLESGENSEVNKELESVENSEAKKEISTKKGKTLRKSQRITSEDETELYRDKIVINSSQIESDKDILESEKPEQKDTKQISPEIHVEKGMRNMYNNLMNLAEALNRIDQLESGENSKVNKELESVENSEVNKEISTKKGNTLRKSQRIASEDISKRNQNKQTEFASNTEADVQILCTGTIPGATPSDGASNERLQEQPCTIQVNENITSKKCRVRLKNISNELPTMAKDLENVIISEESEGNQNMKTMYDLQPLKGIEESKGNTKTMIAEEMAMSGIVKLPEESDESLKALTETNIQSDCVIQNDSPLNSVKSFEQTKSSNASIHTLSNTDNLVKCLLKFTSSDTNECRPDDPSQTSSLQFDSDSPLTNNNYNFKTDQAKQSSTDSLLKSLLKLTSSESNECRLVDNTAPSQSSAVVLHSDSSDEEIAETPPPPDDEDDSKILSFYDKSMSMLYSPLLFTQNSSPSIMPQNKHLRHSRLNSSENNSREAFISVSSSDEATSSAKHSESRVVLTPLDLPPTRQEVVKGCAKLKLPEYEFQQPFYSNPDDVTKQKEIGFTILQINSNKLNDLEEFQSILGADIKGLAAWRRKQLVHLGGPEMLTKYRNAQRVREYFAAAHKTVAITPQMNAPTRQEVKLWLKARELLKNKGGLREDHDEGKKMGLLNEEDSPIKIRRQKITMMLNEGGEGDGGNDSDNSLDCSGTSLTLTPLTPATPLTIDPSADKINKSFTPVTSKLERIPLERLNSLKRRNNRRVLKRVPLNQRLKEALERQQSPQSRKISEASEESIVAHSQILKTSHNRVISQENEAIPASDESIVHHSQSSQNRIISQDNEAIPASDESIVPHSQTSETSVTSQTVLAEMERSSFMRQIEAHDSNNTTLNNTFGFKVALENLQQAKADIEFNYLTIVTLEVFVATRDDLYPNPQIDEIRCLFYAIENSIPNEHIDNDKKLPRTACGYIMVHDARDVVAKEGHIHGIDSDIEVTLVQTEVEALEALLGLCARWDPDIYAGYEIEMCSWGFVMDRAKYLCLNIAPLLSRVPTQKMRDFVDEDRDQFTDLDVEMKLCGRILLDVWRLMRSEIALTSYTFENVMYHIMHKRCPWHSYRALTEWFSSPGSRWIVLEYFLERVRGTLALLDQLDLIGRTSEMAKLIGIQFYEVLSRGSQFRVESMMLRIAKPKNLVPLSPSVQQRAHMRAPEYLALIMEPQSRFYADPLIVLDFQSLYPSMIIGYNYCFSTCLGRVEHLGQSTPFEFGASQLRVSPTMLRKLVERDLITISPCGVVFVKSAVREGILPRMLTEILDTRQMVKQSMKVHKSNSALQRILHSRQLGLKLMANVTYGYTAANFSGRMPAVEVGDSVVSKGRETLERAIKTVEANEKWNVKVVYGDTDSMFVLVPGRNREEAFRIGEEIAEVVTKQNPHPVKLKLEKVYQPCILQTKKRYVGYMYETADQKEPVYEAKGIETVRRDGCPMVAKMLEKVLRILFESADVSQVKQYVCRQFTKLLSGRANLQDLIFAKEFRGMNGYKPNACVPALELTRKWIQTDPRRIPRRGERVPFIVTNGPPGVPLIRLIRHPHEVLADEGLKINAVYYITKAIIPPLNRCLLLLGADVNEWFTNLPRKILMTPALSIANEVITCATSKSKKSTISQFFSTTNCVVDCGRQTKQGICDVCNSNASRSMVTLQTKISKIEKAYLSTQHICQACCGRVGDLNCGSLDCPVLYVLEVKRRDLQQIAHFRNLLEERF